MKHCDHCLRPHQNPTRNCPRCIASAARRVQARRARRKALGHCPDCGGPGEPPWVGCGACRRKTRDRMRLLRGRT